MKCLWKIAAALVVIAGATIVIVKYWDKIMEKLRGCRCGCVTIHEMPEEAPEAPEAAEAPEAPETPEEAEAPEEADAPSAEDFAD